MFKKLLTIGLLMVIIALTMPMVHGQRAIDPLLKPDNAPSVPLTGLSQESCIQRNLSKLHEELYGKDPTKKLDSLSDADKKEIAKYWDENSQMCHGNEEEPITAFIQIIAGALLMLTGGIAVIVITVSGIMYITSGGRQQQMEFAKNTLMYGIIGMVVIIFSYYFVQLIIKLIIGV